MLKIKVNIDKVYYAESDSEEQNNTMSESFELKVPKIERNGQVWLPVFFVSTTIAGIY